MATIPLADYNRPVAVIEVMENNLFLFDNVFDCTRHFGDSVERILRMARDHHCELYLDHYLLCYHDEDEVVWPYAPTRDILEWGRYIRRQQFSVIGYTSYSQEYYIYDSIYKAALRTQCPEYAVYQHVMHRPRVPIHGWVFQPISDLSYFIQNERWRDGSGRYKRKNTLESF